MNQNSKNIALWAFFFVVLMAFWSVLEQPAGQSGEIKYSKFRKALEEKQVSSVTIFKDEIQGKFKEGYGSSDNGKFITHLPPNDGDLIEALRGSGAEFDSKPEPKDSWLFVLLANWFPMLLILGVWIFFMKQLQVGGGKALSFGKSKARLLEEDQNKITFDDVAGIEESKSELTSIVKFLKNPKKFAKLGGRIPKGVLLVGSPGTGKTLLARAIAGEAGVPFFSISGSDFVEMFVGVGASRVRDLFLKGKKNAPCIIFIDEIDAVGRHRGAGLGGGHDEREQTLNQMLVEMDGFEANEGVILIAATNRPDVLDPALLRPGRFDRQVVVPLPDLQGREAILKVHTGKVPLDDNIDLATIARGTPGFSGADLANLVNESALHAALMDHEIVTNKHFEHAKDKIIMGVERKSLVMSDKEKKVTAYHEAGHALVAKKVPLAEPVHKVTIIPRGRALGLMQQLPTADKYNFPKDYWLDQICIAFGGRSAEELTFNEITTGAEGDINQATSIARSMVCEWGMSELLGPLAFGKKEGNVFLGKDIGHQQDYSNSTADKIDSEIKRIVEEQQQRSRDILKENQAQLVNVAEALLAEETLDTKQLDEVLKNGKLDEVVKNGKPEEKEVIKATDSKNKDTKKSKDSKEKKEQQDPGLTPEGA